MIEHWILRGPIRLRRALSFAALFADFVAGSCRERLNTLHRHPEVLAVFGEPRRMATSAVLVAILRDAAQVRGSSG
jgi:hypothetical protein